MAHRPVVSSWPAALAVGGGAGSRARAGQTGLGETSFRNRPLQPCRDSRKGVGHQLRAHRKWHGGFCYPVAPGRCEKHWAA
eukprot:1159525-Alexandrium_andersonii.AAC.1